MIADFSECKIRNRFYEHIGQKNSVDFGVIDADCGFGGGSGFGAAETNSAAGGGRGRAD